MYINIPVVTTHIPVTNAPHHPPNYRAKPLPPLPHLYHHVPQMILWFTEVFIFITDDTLVRKRHRRSVSDPVDDSNDDFAKNNNNNNSAIDDEINECDDETGGDNKGDVIGDGEGEGEGGGDGGGGGDAGRVGGQPADRASSSIDSDDEVDDDIERDGVSLFVISNYLIIRSLLFPIFVIIY